MWYVFPSHHIHVCISKNTYMMCCIKMSNLQWNLLLMKYCNYKPNNNINSKLNNVNRCVLGWYDSSERKRAQRWRTAAKMNDIWMWITVKRVSMAKALQKNAKHFFRMFIKGNGGMIAYKRSLIRHSYILMCM